MKTIKLIEGHFTAEEAREILLSIFSSKLQFHQMKNFSSEERFGKPDKVAKKRIPQLKKGIERIKKITESAQKKNESFKLRSVVSITTQKPKKKSLVK